jgi:hypothetical protein
LPLPAHVTDSNLLVSRLEVNRGRYEEGPTNYQKQAASFKLQAASCDSVAHMKVKKFLIEIAAADGFVY